MTDRFETLLTTALTEYAEGGVRPIEAMSIAVAAMPRSRRDVGAARVSRWRRPVAIVALAAALIIALLAAILLAGTQRRLPSPLSHRNGAILLEYETSAIGGTFGFRSVGADGSIVDLPLSTSRSCPRYSPDGALLAYVTSVANGAEVTEQLVVSDPDGGHQRALWSGHFNSNSIAHSVGWSPNGQFIGASGAVNPAGGSGGVVIAGRDGASARFVPWGAGRGWPDSLSWSPDGRELAAIGSIYDSTSSQIEILNLASGTTRVIVAPAPIHSIAWSPDGRSIAFIASTSAAAESPGNLFVVPADGSASAIAQSPAAGDETQVVWSPDAGSIAVLARLPGSGAVGSGEPGSFMVRLVGRDGANIREIGPFSSTDNISITWAPDGASLLLSGGGIAPNGRSVPIVVSLTGEPNHILPGPYAQGCPPSWQPLPP